MHDTHNDVHKDVHSLFYAAQSLSLLSCNSEKENFRASPNLTPEDRKLKEKACEDKAITLMKVYRALEEQVRRVENPVTNPKRSGPSKQILTAKVKQAKEALFSRVLTLIEMLTQNLVALTNTVNSINPVRNDIIYGCSSDLKDSVETKIERLQRQIKRWERRICNTGISLNPLKDKICKLGKKTKIKIVKTKGSHKVFDTSLTARRDG